MNLHVAIAGVEVVCVNKGAMFKLRAESKFWGFQVLFGV